MTFSAVAAGLILGLVLAFGLLRSWEPRRAGRLLARWRRTAGDELTLAAQARSRAVIRGQVAEQVAPLTGAFPWSPEDARFLGKPIDYVVFDGLGAVRRGERDHLVEIVFVDVKTGRAGLTRSERRVRDCIEEGRVDVIDTVPSTPPASQQR